MQHTARADVGRGDLDPSSVRVPGLISNLLRSLSGCPLTALARLLSNSGVASNAPRQTKRECAEQLR